MNTITTHFLILVTIATIAWLYFSVLKWQAKAKCYRALAVKIAQSMHENGDVDAKTHANSLIRSINTITTLNNYEKLNSYARHLEELDVR